MRKIIGFTLISSPIWGIFIYSMIEHGAIMTLKIFGASGVVLGAIILGAYLITKQEK